MFFKSPKPTRWRDQEKARSQVSNLSCCLEARESVEQWPLTQLCRRTEQGKEVIHSETLKSLGFGGSSYVRRRGEELGLKNRATYLDLHMGHFLNLTHTLLL